MMHLVVQSLMGMLLVTELFLGMSSLGRNLGDTIKRLNNGDTVAGIASGEFV